LENAEIQSRPTDDGVEACAMIGDWPGARKQRMSILQ
jgi:hypothetical protein